MPVVAMPAGEVAARDQPAGAHTKLQIERMTDEAISDSQPRQTT